MIPPERVVDRRLTAQAPYPIAVAWSRVRVATNDAEREQRAVDAVGVVLRYLAAIAAADALQADPSVATGQERLWAQLKRPSLGHWVELLRELSRQNTTPFVPELKEALFDQRGKPSEVLKALDALVAQRNRIAHGSALERPEAGAIEQQLRTLLDAMGWLASYRLVRVVHASPARSGDTEGALQMFVGQVALTEPVPATWSAHLVPDVVYLASPDGRKLLDVTPFLELGEDPSLRAPRCLLVHAIGRTLSLESVETGQRIEVEPEDAERGWLTQPSPRVVEVPELASVLAAPSTEHAADGSSAEAPSKMSVAPGSSGAVPAAERSRWGRWLRRLAVVAAMGLVVLMVAGIALVNWLYPTFDVDPPPITLVAVPALYDDPADQRRLERAHAALVDGDKLTATMLIEPLLDRSSIPPEVAGLVMLFGESLPSTVVVRSTLRVDGARAQEQSALAYCIREMKELVTLEEAGPETLFVTVLPRLVRLGNATQSRMEEHPDDLVALACGCGIPDSPFIDCNHWIDGLGDPADFPILLDWKEDWSLETIDAALARRAGSASLQMARVRSLMRQRRWPEATTSLESIVEEHPTRLDLRLLAAELALLRGDDAAFRLHYQLLRSEEWGSAVAHNVDRDLVATALRAGRPALALDLFRRPEHLRGWGSAVDKFGFYAQHLPEIVDDSTLSDWSEKVELALSQPVRDSAALVARRNHLRVSNAISLQVALRQDPSAVPPTLIDQNPSHYMGSFTDEMRVAAWNGHGQALFDVDVPDRAAVWHRWDCTLASTGASLLAVAGEQEASLDYWSRLLEQETCRGLENLATFAIAHGNLALAAHEDGDEAKAAEHAAAFAEVWPRPEPDVPIVRRMVDAGLFTVPPAPEAAPPDPD